VNPTINDVNSHRVGGISTCLENLYLQNCEIELWTQGYEFKLLNHEIRDSPKQRHADKLIGGTEMFGGKKAYRAKPNEVFTPKAPLVNEDMYITRPHLEKTLKRAIDGTYHIIVHGDSGSGKSWLYKNVLKEIDCEYITINLPNASSNQSISETFKWFLNQMDDVKKVEYTQKKMAEVNSVVAKGQIDHVNKYVLTEKEPFLQCLEYVRKKAKKKHGLIVFENLEAIFKDENLMRELGNLILLLDDEVYAKFNVKFLIVGVPNGIKEYFSKIDNTSSISNRLEEIPQVSKLSKEQVRTFVVKGFVEKLKVDLAPQELEELTEDVYWSTLGIPQRLHEYCLKVAFSLEDNGWTYNQNILKSSKGDWINQSLTSNYLNIEKLMNSRDTVVQRKNQVLYALGKVNKEEFKPSDIEELIINEFPSTAKVTMNIGQLLSEISSSDNPPIKKTPKGDSYTFVDPKFCICIRMMLAKNADGKVEKISIGEM
jgi:hypothetical protein